MKRQKRVYFVASWNEMGINDGINTFLDDKYTKNKNKFNLISVDIKPIVINETVAFSATILYQE